MSPPRSAVIRHFDAQADTYQDRARHGLWAWQRRREAGAILALTGPMNGRSALDLGAGAGFYARLLAERGAQPTVAVDASAAMVARIDHPGLEAIEGDIATIKLGRRFDVVLLAGVLEFVDDAQAALCNAARHVAAGGIMVLLVPTDNTGGRLYRRFHSRHGFAINLFGRHHVQRLAAVAGLALAGERPVAPFSAVYALAPR